MSSDSSPISEREREILRLVAMGATNQQIAYKLNISINTVKVHLRNIFRKIEVASRTEATVYAIRQGLVSVENEPAFSSPPSEVGTSLAIVEPLPSEPLPVITNPALVQPVLSESAQTDIAVEPLVLSEVPEGSSKPFIPTILVSRKVSLIAYSIILCLLLAGGAVYGLSQQWYAAPATPTMIANISEASRWRSRAPMQHPRTGFAVVAYDSKLYTIGGSDANGPSATVERYDPVNNIWVSLNEKPTAVSHVQSVTIGGWLYVPGGEDASGRPLTVFEAYDPRAQQWKTLPELPAPRSRYALASLEGDLYLFGGWDGSRVHAEVFVYNPGSQRWSERSPMPTPRRNAGAAVIENYIYVIGGEREDRALQVNERYDPTQEDRGRWESVTPLSNPIADPAATGVVNTVLVFDPQRRAAAQYVPTTDVWIPLSVPDGIAVSSRAVSLGPSVFVFGPSRDSMPSTVSEYQAAYTIFLPIMPRR